MQTWASYLTSLAALASSLTGGDSITDLIVLLWEAKEAICINGLDLSPAVGGPHWFPIWLLFLFIVVLLDGTLSFVVLLNLTTYYGGSCEQHCNILSHQSYQKAAEPDHSLFRSLKINSCKKHKSSEAKVFSGIRAPSCGRSGRSAFSSESPCFKFWPSSSSRGPRCFKHWAESFSNSPKKQRKSHRKGQLQEQKTSGSSRPGPLIRCGQASSCAGSPGCRPSRHTRRVHWDRGWMEGSRGGFLEEAVLFF